MQYLRDFPRSGIPEQAGSPRYLRLKLANKGEHLWIELQGELDATGYVSIQTIVQQIF